MVELTPAELARLLLVFVMMTLGVGALLAGILRRHTAARALILFGLFSCVYGLLVASTLSVTGPTTGLSPAALTEIRFGLSYVVLLPLMLLVEQFVGRGWRGTMRATVWLQTAYSTIAVATELVTGIQGVPGVVQTVKPYVVLVIGTGALGNILYAARRTRDVPRVLAVGFISFFATVGVYNFQQIIHGPNVSRIETLGFIVLVGCLAYGVGVHARDTEERLLAIDREIQSAQRIQASILPRELPVIPGVTVCVRYRPMATMAGDFYDFLGIEGGRLGVLVADVLGHGVPASLIASMVKVALNAEASHADDPGAVLSGMNATLVGLLGRDRDYVTACYLVVDPTAGELLYGQAGHPPPLLQSPDGNLCTLDEGGTILGQFTTASYQSTRRRVDPGSRLLVYTDGVTEAMSPAGEPFGMDRLEAFMAPRRDTRADEVADALLETVTTWRGNTKLDDDVTIVVVDIQRRGTTTI